MSIDTAALLAGIRCRRPPPRGRGPDDERGGQRRPHDGRGRLEMVHYGGRARTDEHVTSSTPPAHGAMWSPTGAGWHRSVCCRCAARQRSCRRPNGSADGRSSWTSPVATTSSPRPEGCSCRRPTRRPANRATPGRRRSTSRSPSTSWQRRPGPGAVGATGVGRAAHVRTRPCAGARRGSGCAPGSGGSSVRAAPASRRRRRWPRS